MYINSSAICADRLGCWRRIAAIAATVCAATIGRAVHPAIASRVGPVGPRRLNPRNLKLL